MYLSLRPGLCFLSLCGCRFLSIISLLLFTPLSLSERFSFYTTHLFLYYRSPIVLPPSQILPTAQKLLDELLTGHESSAINSVCGAPDPTAGPSAQDSSFWCLDEPTLHENIKKTLSKFCVPSPIVFRLESACLGTSTSICIV